MRLILVALLCLFVPELYAATYYFSTSTGDDSRTAAQAQNPATPWKTIAKLNSFFSSLSPGDAVLFNRGEEFPGAISFSRSGTSGTPITIGAYGSGAKPVITGFQNITNWISIGNGLYESVLAAGLSSLNMVTFNNSFQPIGRWPKLTDPNKGYKTISARSGTSSITSTDISSAPNFVGGELVTRAAHWILDRGTITGQTSTTVNYTPFSSPYVPPVGFGFFFQNHPNACTALGDWAYTTSSRKITMFFGGAGPGSYVVKASSVDNLVTLSSCSYITFDNIAFQGANINTFNLTSSNHIVINACDISFTGRDAVFASGSSTANTVSNSTFLYTNNNGITGGTTTAWTITGNTFTNTGSVAGMGVSSDGQYEAMAYIGANSLIELNNILNSGYIGIFFQGANTKVQKNFVNNFSFVKDDGAGIYSLNSSSPGSKVLNNIVMNGIGAKEGTTEKTVGIAMGIYMDDNVTGIEIGGNTVANNAEYGIYLHNCNNINIHDNISYNNKISQIEYSHDGSTISNITNINNVYFARTAAEHISDVHNYSESSISQWFITANNNYYCRPLNENGSIYVALSTGAVATNLTGWKTYTGQEANSKTTPVAITDTNKIRFEFNATNTNKIVSLGANYITVDGTAYPGTITLAPFASAILLQTSGTVNQAPVANAGPDQIITLPASSVILSGNGTDADGSISAYSWTKIAGPAQFNILSPNNQQTTVNNLVQGVYQFQLQVTDTAGTIATDIVSVTVNTSGSLTGSGLSSSDTVNLSTEGTADWAHWFGYDRMSSGGSKISNYMIVGSGSVLNYSDDPRTCTWSDGTPTTSGSNKNGIFIAGIGNGFQIIVPAGLTTNTLKVYVGGWISGGTLTAQLSDGSSPDYVNSSFSDTGQYNAVYTLTYNAASEGTILTVKWIQSSGTGNVTLQAATLMQTTGSLNQLPVANAGPDQIISLPINSVILTGSGTDADGSITTYSWTKIDGPTQFNIVTPTNAQTTLNNLSQGVYQFQLQVTDNAGAVATDIVSVTINTSGSLTGSGLSSSDTVNLTTEGTADWAHWFGYDRKSSGGSKISNYMIVGSGSVLNYSDDPRTCTWSDGTPTTSGSNKNGIFIAGIGNGFQIIVPAGLTTSTLKVYVGGWISGGTLTAQLSDGSSPDYVNSSFSGTGQYNAVYTLTYNAASEGTILTVKWVQSSGTGNVTLQAATLMQTTGSLNKPPVANAGPDKNLILPINSVTLTGSGTDIVSVTVNAASPPNQLPTANAGVNQTISLPVKTVTLTGIGNDPDGTISVKWLNETGGTIGTSASITLTNLTEGVYNYTFSVTDNQGAIDRDTMSITINAAPPSNQLPIANAGTDQNITLPTNSITQTGSGSDPDGSVSSYLWTKISGPATYNIVSPAQPQTVINNLVQGTYRFELRVTDNQGAIARDTVEINVFENLSRISTAIIYPNPATTSINVRIDAVTNSNKGMLQIISVSGIIVYQREIIRSQQTVIIPVDISSLETGTYLMKINLDINNSITLKFIKH